MKQAFRIDLAGATDVRQMAAYRLDAKLEDVESRPLPRRDLALVTRYVLSRASASAFRCSVAATARARSRMTRARL